MPTEIHRTYRVEERCRKPLLVLKVNLLFAPEETHGIRYITLHDDHIDDISVQKPRRGTVLDLTGKIVCPGLIDVGVYGYGGHDLSDGRVEDLQAVAAGLPSFGITSFVPSLSASPGTPLLQLVRQATPLLETITGARPLGFHIEGPFYHRSFSARDDPDLAWLPTAETVRILMESGRILMTTIAPELPGAMNAIATLSAAGIVCALGHTCASFATAEQAYAVGARSIDHLFNEMKPFHHRDPGVVGAAFVLPFYVQFVADGLHTDPEVLRVVHLIARRLVVASLSITTTGMTQGSARVSGEPVTVTRDGARDRYGHLVGSMVPLNCAVANLVAMGQFSYEEAIRCGTSVPADMLHLPDRGRIRPGMIADIAVFDRSFHPFLTIGEGTVLYRNQKGLS